MYTLNPLHPQLHDQMSSTVIQVKISEQGRIFVLSNVPGVDAVSVYFIQNN